MNIFHQYTLHYMRYNKKYDIIKNIRKQKLKFTFWRYERWHIFGKQLQTRFELMFTHNQSLTYQWLYQCKEEWDRIVNLSHFLGKTNCTRSFQFSKKTLKCRSSHSLIWTSNLVVTVWILSEKPLHTTERKPFLISQIFSLWQFQTRTLTFCNNKWFNLMWDVIR